VTAATSTCVPRLPPAGYSAPRPVDDLASPRTRVGGDVSDGLGRGQPGNERASTLRAPLRPPYPRRSRREAAPALLDTCPLVRLAAVNMVALHNDTTEVQRRASARQRRRGAPPSPSERTSTAPRPCARARSMRSVRAACCLFTALASGGCGESDEPSKVTRSCRMWLRNLRTK
jgi:hypothetical protein